MKNLEKKRMLISAVTLLLTVSALAKTCTSDEFRVRDPFVLAENGTYYLYASIPKSDGLGVSMRMSKDLESWSASSVVMKVPEGVRCKAVWAPEVHKYRGKYWLITTLTLEQDLAHDVRPMLEKGFKGGVRERRGVWVFRADNPTGPFLTVKDCAVTPADWMSLDGTLYVEDGKPWMIFCHEWCQTGNGRMMAVRMTDDLSAFATEPIELFRAANVLPGAGCVTDGPFLFVNPDAGLGMIWSNFLEGGGYCVIQCKSATGKIAGPWHHFAPLFRDDGGHGMLFRRFDGQLMLTLHQPNGGGKERMKFFPVRMSKEGLSLGNLEPSGPK